MVTEKLVLPKLAGSGAAYCQPYFRSNHECETAVKIQQFLLKTTQDATVHLRPLTAADPQLVTIFGASSFLTDPLFVEAVTKLFAGAAVVGCSTAGEISDGGVSEDSCTVTAISFEATRVKSVSSALSAMSDSRGAGERIGKALCHSELRAILVFGPGVQINGSALVDGVTSIVGSGVPVMGGLAGDGGAFKQTWTWGVNGVTDNHVIGLGLYGNSLDFSYGCFGGWEPFGPERRITRCDGNVLYELDGKPALDIYKRYLGEYAKGLPASGLLFPLAILGADRKSVGLIRTILGIDESNGSLTLAGAIESNGYVKLMHASTDKLVDGAEAAAEDALSMHSENGDGLAILISCIGRKLVMGERVEEEVEAVSSVLGNRVTRTGFYSYGEISPFGAGGHCHLHNQTMTITWLSER
jgi:hypothetical protein